MADVALADDIISSPAAATATADDHDEEKDEAAQEKDGADDEADDDECCEPNTVLLKLRGLIDRIRQKNGSKALDFRMAAELVLQSHRVAKANGIFASSAIVARMRSEKTALDAHHSSEKVKAADGWKVRRKSRQMERMVKKTGSTSTIAFSTATNLISAPSSDNDESF